MASQRCLSLSIQFEPRGDAESLSALLQKTADDGAKSIMVLSADSDAYTAAALDPILTSLSVPVFGGVFPCVIFEGRVHETGSIVIGLNQALSTHVLSGLSDPHTDFIQQLEALSDDHQFGETLFVVVDGFGLRISALFQDLYEIFGQHHAFLGGGAGSLRLTRKPCIYSNQGLLEDVALLVDFPFIKSIAIEHGWEAMAGPFVVTSAQNTTVEAIDFSPAFDVYKSVIETSEPVSFDKTDFFDIAKNFPVGMTRYGGDFVVRDALSVDHGAINFVGEIPENQEIYVLRGNNRQLIEAAIRCAHSASESEQGPIMSLTFDCASRWLYLQDDFQKEIDSIAAEFPSNCNNIGVLCAGEVAGNGQCALEFHNKTVTIGAVVPEA